MNNPIKSLSSKTEERKKRLEAALRRNILRRKAQSLKRDEIEPKLKRGATHDNV